MGGFVLPEGDEPMPYKPRRSCSYPSCPKLTDGRFCEEHAKQEAGRYERYQRDPATRKLYGRTWRKVHDRDISAHPLCEHCEKNGRFTPAEEVHHIKPLAQDGTNVVRNLMSLCSLCHSEITACEGGRWQKRLE